MLFEHNACPVLASDLKLGVLLWPKYVVSCLDEEVSRSRGALVRKIIFLAFFALFYYCTHIQNYRF